MTLTSKRVSILKYGTRKGGKVVPVPDTWAEFLNVASSSLQITAKQVYNAHECEIDDIALICNDDVLYIADDKPTANGDTTELQFTSTDNINVNKSDVIKLNIGGKYFATFRSTLLKEPNSMLAKLATSSLQDDQHKVDETGVFFFDRNPIYFEYILEYLRYGELVLKDNAISDSILKDAKFFGIDSLVKNWSKVTSYSFVDPRNQPATILETTSDAKKMGDIIHLNVGGKHFTALRATLCKEPDSMLAKMFDPDLLLNPSKLDNTGAFFIDSDPRYFECILNYLRSGTVVVDKYMRPDLLLKEATFYGIDSLADNWEDLGRSFEKSTSRYDLIRLIYPKNSANMQHLRFDGTNLSEMYFVNLNFKCASFRGCRIVNTIFRDCNLTDANFKGAFLQKITLESGNVGFCNSIDFEGADLENITSHSIHFNNCNFTGAVFKSVQCERAAFNLCNFKNASLSNIAHKPKFAGCDFTNATLIDCTGTQVSNSNFTGAKLTWTDDTLFFERLYDSDFTVGLIIGAYMYKEVEVNHCNFTETTFEKCFMSNCLMVRDDLLDAFSKSIELLECNLLNSPPPCGVNCRSHLKCQNNFFKSIFNACKLSECYLTEKSLKKAKFEKKIIIPDLLREWEQ